MLFLIKKLCGMLLLTAMIAMSIFSANINVSAQVQSTPVFTPEEQEYIAAHSSLKVGFVPDRIPVSFADKNGDFSGVSRYVLDRISELSGIRFEYAALPTKDVTYDYLMSENFSLVTSVEYNEENKHARGILISRPYFSSRKVVVARDKLDFKFDENYNIAVSTGSQTLKKVLERLFPNSTIQDHDTIPECFDAVKSGEADIMIQNQYIVEYWLSKPKYENLKCIPVMGFEDELCFSAVVDFGENSQKSQNEGNILIGILDKTIACLSEDEIVNYTIQGVMENQYSYDFGDFFSRYKYSVIIFCVSAFAIIILVILLVRQKIHIAESRASEKAKGEFLSTMSHEIRTPLNGMIGLNNLMSEKLDDPQRLEIYLKQSTVAAKYLLSLVNDMLDSSKLQADMFKLESRPIDMALLTETVTTTVAGSMKERGLNFTSDIKISDPYIIGDSVRIQQVLFNLLDNAEKFTPAGGNVRLTFSQKANGYEVMNVFVVSDTGRGMSEEFRARVFDAFARELDTVSKGNQGTGLGLSISFRLARLMDGDLTCESEKGKGSTFTFSFSALPSSEPENVIHKPSDNDLVKKRVLVAEDNELNAEIILEILSREGFQADLAENGKKALEMFVSSETGTYGIILMDLMMPELDGFGATKAIRALKRPDAKTVRIIACTANSFNGERERAFECGMNEFVTKPVDIDELLEKMYG